MAKYVRLKEESNYPFKMVDILKAAVELKGSDLHIVPGAKPAVRILGDIHLIENMPILYPNDIQKLIYSTLNDVQIEDFEVKLEMDYSYSIPGVSLFRGNIMIQRGTIAACFRPIPFGIPDFNKLGLPESVKEFCNLNRGLVLVTGPTGSGKSTTLAAIIDMMNKTRRLNIITMEDPIEFLHTHKKSIIKQREVGNDTHSFANALRHVLRHDPDVILIGEMRDPDSISIALTAAETGHIVFSTLHTQTAPLTISRIVDVFDGSQKAQVRQQLANSLRGILTQQLLPRADGKGMIPAVELLRDTPAIKNMIREKKEHMIYSAMMTGQAYGMQTMDQALSDLFNRDLITRDEAYIRCIDKTEVMRLMKKDTNAQALKSRRW